MPRFPSVVVRPTTPSRETERTERSQRRERLRAELNLIRRQRNMIFHNTNQQMLNRDDVQFFRFFGENATMDDLGTRPFPPGTKRLGKSNFANLPKAGKKGSKKKRRKSKKK